MDSMQVSGAWDAGSIPAGATTNLEKSSWKAFAQRAPIPLDIKFSYQLELSKTLGPIVQWIE